MYQADLNHPSKSLQDKLHALYNLSRGIALDLQFRPPYLGLLEAFGNPQDHLPPIIHVAGTNGKGSTIATLRAILQEAGYKVHVYTSPHLRRFNERIVLAGNMIDDVMLEDLIDEAIEKNDGAQITFFEITTAIAFEAFRRVHADILLLEVGLGGRLDCTNIITKPYVSIINKISMDHTEFLGHDLSTIASEKAGIIKEGVPCVAGYQFPQNNATSSNIAMDKIVDESVHKNAPLYRAGYEWSCEAAMNQMIFTFEGERITLPRPNLIGEHQIENAGAALAALKILDNHFPVSNSAIIKGLQKIDWPGRLEQITDSDLNDHLPAEWSLWYDGGHNDSAGAALGKQIQRWRQEDPLSPIHIILGMKGDKNPALYLESILPQAQTLSLVDVAGIGACVTEAQIAPLFPHPPCQFLRHQSSLKSAIVNISRHCGTSCGRIVICGSLYLAEKI